MIGFVMTRKITSEKSALYWKECHRCIREHHPDAFILIIDDHSDPAFLTDSTSSPPLFKTLFLQSEFEPGVGELLAFYYYHKYGKSLFSRAVIMHDSTFLRAPIPNDKIQRMCFLWHFKEHYWDNNEAEAIMIRRLHTTPPSLLNDLLFFYFEKMQWYGTFGVQCVIDYDHLDRIIKKYTLFDLIPHLRTRNDRSCLERVMGCLLMYETPEMMSSFPSVGGSIIDSVGGMRNTTYSWEAYHRDKATETKKIIKVWTGR